MSSDAPGKVLEMADELRDSLAIQDLISRFAWAVDRDGSHDMGRFFTDDAKLYLPDPADGWQPTQMLAGKEKIAARWHGRDPSIVTRHVGVNVEISFTGEDRAVVRSVGLGFRHTGSGPGVPIPVVVADYDDICVRGADGEWRFLERKITPHFVDPERLPR